LRYSPKWTIELALMADGVPTAQVYSVLRQPGGIDRAFKKLDALKPSISWWKLGAESIQLLGSGEVTMAAAYSGRVTAANLNEGKSITTVWDAGSLYFLDYWTIVKGTPNRDAAMKFIASTGDPARQVEFAGKSTYGPTLVAAYDRMDPKLKAEMPSPDRLAHSVLRDDEFWLEQGDSLTERFNVWAAQK
jgi:putative spermidine/putrescine transport system substrate-binding protein